MNKCDLCQNKTYCADSRSAKESCKANYYEAFSPCSNADCIRAMTVEELAEWLAQHTRHNARSWEIWLLSPVEERDNV